MSKIIFDINKDPISGLEWRQILLDPGKAPRVLCRSSRLFSSRNEVLSEIQQMIKVFHTQGVTDVYDGPYLTSSTIPHPQQLQPIDTNEEVHRIAHDKEVPVRKDIDG